MRIVRPIQTGRVQQYLLFALSIFVIVGAIVGVAIYLLA